MKNSYLEYYGEHNISPVHQNISNIEIHFERRRKLYRQCGIPMSAFKNAEILEVGPGGGYNTLAFFQWGCAHVDLVEANEKGRHDMIGLFERQNVLPEKFSIFPCQIENYVTDKKYDIIIAEGFIQHLPNQLQILKKLQTLSAENGIIVITCTDYLCFFIETMKRLVARFLVKDITDYEDRVRYLSELFEPQLAELKGMSRPVRDWVQDMILFEGSIFTKLLNLPQAISFFQREYNVLGTSPQMFTDYSWYKDIWFDYIEDFKQQYDRKKVSLLLAGMPERILSCEKTRVISEHFKNIINLAMEAEKNFEDCYIKEIIDNINNIEIEMINIDDEFSTILCEVRMALQSINGKENVDFNQYPHFFRAFGKTQHYIAFERK